MSPARRRPFARVIATALAFGGTAIAVALATPAAAAPVITALVPTTPITVGSGPESVAVSPDGGTIYTANVGDDTVSVVDAATGTEAATIMVGSHPLWVAVSPDGGTVYVANLYGNSMSVIDAATHSVMETVPVGVNPRSVAVSPDGGTVYVTNWDDDTLSVIDAATNVVTGTVPVGDDPVAAAVSPDGGTVYVTNSYDNSLSVVDAAARVVTSTVPVGDFPTSVVVSPDGGTVYVTNFLDNSLSVVDAASRAVTATVSVGEEPRQVVVSPDGGTVYVASQADDTVSVVDANTNTATQTVSVDANPVAVAVSPDGGTVYVGHSAGTSLSVLAAESPAVAVVTFNANGGSGSMPTQSIAVGEAAPLSPLAFSAPADHEFASWNTAADGSGTAYADEEVYGFDEDLTLYAQWSSTVIATLELHGPAVVAELDSAAYTVEGFNAVGEPLGDVTAHTTLATDFASDAVTGHRIAFGFDAAAIGGTATRTLTATLMADDPVSATLPVTVTSVAHAIRLVAPATADQGDVITVTVEALDEGGQVLGDATGVVLITSSVGTDVITGNRVQFVHASPHVLTATVPTADGFAASATVEVEPSGLLASTGAEVLEPLVAGLVLVVLGGVVLVSARRRVMS